MVSGEGLDAYVKTGGESSTIKDLEKIGFRTGRGQGGSGGQEKQWIRVALGVFDAG